MKRLILALLLLTSCASKQGPQGAQGVSGHDGINGTSCTLTEVDNGALLTCPDGTAALIETVNGKNPFKCLLKHLRELKSVNDHGFKFECED